MAFLKGSRYEGTQLFGDGASFKGVRPRPIGPASPVLEHSVSLKERLSAGAGILPRPAQLDPPGRGQPAQPFCRRSAI